MNEAEWIERAQSAEAKLKTCQDNVERVREDARQVLAMLGAKKRSNGSFDIDFEKLVINVGLEGAMQLRQVIDETYRVSGEPGEKPKIRLSA